MSQITTHVLDTSRGLPANGIAIELFDQENDGWKSLAKGVTDSDGRISNLLSKEMILPAGNYRVHFSTADYFEQKGETYFYPFVDIVFSIDGSGTHYHIPLLLTAFGYSTYRGS